ncbi:hypothetical protein FD00_GL001794 [Liquorilactobacillus mali KCTC 3596 = DSM 20444]|uniref:Uncharacterized protein n=1 Tax=Liquorilactobacillus mali KCTC 3596 = DSM 20444 TaxID=1046596 RepID=A0A0R2E6H4_9LACO|nr:hypothetical protein FD00_GL001794 [Liquorilactobacillus mali KCTC 3596 = DSM 20444]
MIFHYLLLLNHFYILTKKNLAEEIRQGCNQHGTTLTSYSLDNVPQRYAFVHTPKKCLSLIILVKLSPTAHSLLKNLQLLLFHSVLIYCYKHTLFLL